MTGRGQHKTRLTATPAFHRLCQGFHQDCMFDVQTVDELAGYVLQHVAPTNHQDLAAFIDHLLDGTYTPAELKGFMNRSTRDISWRTGDGVVDMLNRIRARLEPSPR